MYISERAFYMNASFREASRIDIKSAHHILVLHKFSVKTNTSIVGSVGSILEFARIGNVQNIFDIDDK